MREKPKLICYDDDLIRKIISFYGYVTTGLTTSVAVVRSGPGWVQSERFRHVWSF